MRGRLQSFPGGLQDSVRLPKTRGLQSGSCPYGSPEQPTSAFPCGMAPAPQLCPQLAEKQSLHNTHQLSPISLEGAQELSPAPSSSHSSKPEAVWNHPPHPQKHLPSVLRQPSPQPLPWSHCDKFTYPQEYSENVSICLTIHR